MSKKYYEQHKRKILKQQHAWYKRNKELIQAKQKIYAAHHKREIQEYGKIWRLNHKKYIHEANAKRWRENKTSLKEKSNAYNKRTRLKACEIVGRGKIRCAKCGIEDFRIMEINHIKGNNDHVKSQSFYRKIIRGERKIDDLNLLCKICNYADYIEKTFGIKFYIRVQ